MKDNATFIEFATFFFIIAFSVTMTKMQWDHNDNVVQNKVDRELKIQNDADEVLAWYDRITRIQSIGIIHHDGDPNTNLFDVIIDASSYVDPDKDFISYSWVYSKSWDNRYDKNQIFEIKANYKTDIDELQLVYPMTKSRFSKYCNAVENFFN